MTQHTELITGPTPYRKRPLAAGNVRLVDTGISNRGMLTITDVATEQCWSTGRAHYIKSKGLIRRTV